MPTSRGCFFMCTDVTNDAKTISNSLWKSSCTTGIKNIIKSLQLWIKLRQADNVEHWLLIYFLKHLFWILFNPKKLRWTFTICLSLIHRQGAACSSSFHSSSVKCAPYAETVKLVHISSEVIRVTSFACIFIENLTFWKYRLAFAAPLI